MNQPELSVIIPVHNLPALVAEAVRSARAAAEGLTSEVIVVDDASDEATATALRELRTAGEIDQLLTLAANGGPSAARNAGIRAARGEFIGLLDADDLRLPGTYARQAAFLRASPTVGGVLDHVRVERLDGSNAADPGRLLQVGALLVRRELFAPERVGLFDENMRFGEDVDWFMRARDRGERLAQRDDLAVRYRRHPQSLTTNLAPARAGLAHALHRSLRRRRAERSPVSVVIPAYQAEKYLPAALESVLAQTEPPLEVIVVDDGSTDRTAEVVRGFGPRGVKLLSQPHCGAAAARNRGVDAATGEWLAFLDADDLWPADRLARQLELLAADPAADGAFGLMRQFVSPDLSLEQQAQVACPLTFQPAISSGAMLIRAAAFRRVGAFDPRWAVGEFIDWHARAVDAGLRFLVPQFLALERRLHTSNSGRRESDRQDFARIVKAALDRRRGPKAP